MAGRLHQRSVQVILANQDAGGAYPASPTFPTYRYCWLRDGSFIAHAMDLTGERDSARRFHEWTAGVIGRRRERVARTVQRVRDGEPLSEHDYLHTRFTLSGEEASDGHWPNHQLDGYGTWLWAVSEHCRCTGEPLPDGWRLASDAVADYLAALWRYPCFDCWEEFPDRMHTYTLAAVHAGLRAHAALTGAGHAATIDAIEAFVLEHCLVAGRAVKFPGSDRVDASLIGLAVPYGVLLPADPHMRATVERIESTLRAGGGVHRYAEDTYYGGGEWVLLTAWLGWYYMEAGERAKAEAALRWVEAQADGDGLLPEQVPHALNDASQFEPWVQRWGPIARPLLWSHASYLILSHKLAAG